ncbi:MAG: glycine cleavage system protein GcvH [Candidatus Muirbacterium halophilum]|nr:glycine cleavage system protein GcvH [Candidatus Muirbacterium halophilum]MCK9474690.1 glycine cleavage system protein GcvH [Candidatus Muirbacterium halophilum]
MADTLLYAKTHEWVKVKGNIATIGISDYAQGELGDIVFVEMPEVDDEFESQNSLGSIESVKTVTEFYAPISGTVVEINEALEDTPENINEDPFGEGWILKLKISDETELEELMGSSDYKFYLKELHEEED